MAKRQDGPGGEGSLRRRAGRAAAVPTAIVSLLFLVNLPSDVASGPHFVIMKQTEHLRVPVVMVVFDEFPVASLMNERGGIDSRAFPNFGRLQRDATWYRNTDATAVFTHEALPAILTGKVSKQGAALDDVYPRNLFTLLGDAYKVKTYDSLPGFCPKRFCDLHRPHPSETELGPGFKSFGGGERGTTVGSFIDLIDRPGPGARKPFYFAHFVIPHSPWRYLPSGQRYPEEAQEPGEVDIPGPGRAWNDDRWLTEQVWQRHLLQVSLTDRILGAIVEQLRSEGMYDESLLIVTADHGVAFEPGHPKRYVDSETAGHVAPVPLFIKSPHQHHGRISDAPLRSTDILPTIADILDLSNVWTGLDGRSALAHDIPPDRQRNADGYWLDPLGSEKYDVVRRKFHTFGSTNGSIDLFDLGPGRTDELLGRDITDVAPYTLGSDTVTLDDAELEVADPTAPMVPALLEGTIEGADRRIIAITVDGVVRAVTRTYRAGDETRFYAMVDPNDLGPAPNAIDAYVVIPPSG